VSPFRVAAMKDITPRITSFPASLRLTRAWAVRRHRLLASGFSATYPARANAHGACGHGYPADSERIHDNIDP
jgi:hypothetical protein